MTLSAGRRRSQKAAIVGESVRAARSEKSTAADAVKPKGLKNRPRVPPIKPIGKKTATIVSVDATSVRPISLFARSAAWRGVSPSSRWRTMFSTATIASSTMTPTTSARAKSVIVSRLKWSSLITSAVPSSDVGIASAEIVVARQSPKNGQITRIASNTARPRASCVARAASRMNVACVEARTIVAGESPGTSAATASSQASATSRALALPDFTTAIATAGCPS